MATHALIQNILRSPDDVKVVLEATLVDTATTRDNINTPHDPRRDLQNRRVLAVVSHKDDWDLTEEGSLFVCKYKSTNGPQEELDIQRVLPIYGEFTIGISQMRRGTLDLRSTSSSTPASVLDQSRAVISLSVTPAEGLPNDAQPPTFFTHDVQSLRSLVAECRRLKEVTDVDANAVINLAQSTTHFSWLKPYFAKRTTIAALTNMPQDLRQINQPLLDRLSPACAGLTGDDHADVQLIRDDWILTKARDMSRKERRRLSLRLGTFNVNGKMPSQDLSAWIQGVKPILEVDDGSPSLPPMQSVSPLSLGEVLRNPFDRISRKAKSLTSQHGKDDFEKSPSRVDEDDPGDPDMLVLGFQELDLSTEALLYSTSTAREDAWCLAIFAALGEKAVKYEKLASKQLVGMLILIIVKKSLKNSFGEVKTSVAGAGILGVMGNKGGTAVRLSFTPPSHPNSPGEKSPNRDSIHASGPTSFTFVNAHLAAFDEMVEKRNSDFQDLSKRLGFEYNGATPVSPGADEEGSNVTANDVLAAAGMGLTQYLSVYETDALFWMVHLNYRVDISDHAMRKTLRDEEWDNAPKFEALLQFDQLKKAMQSKKAFDGFQESPITHLPTYRFSPGLMMDKLGYDLKRKPAWTDRILYMHGPACRVHQLSYTGHPQIGMSDHRPVAADFSVDVDLYSSELRKATVRKLFNEVEHLEGESTHDRGALKIEDTYVDFGTISYDKTIERKLRVKNTSKSPSAFRFVPIQIDSPIHPEWLQIYPLTGILLPNEVTEILIRAYVDNPTALLLNQGPKDLSGTLILHTVLGKDHFISVSGEYQYTCFANKLTRLTRLRGPIRSMDSPNDLLPENHSINAPREIMRLVNWMMTSTANTDGMFLTLAPEETVHVIRECLDTGNEFPFPPDTSDPEIPLAFAVTLLRFLDSLADPIIPASLHPQCLQTSNRDEAFELLDDLPPGSVNVWISVTAFLHFICHASEKQDHAALVADVIAPILLRDDPSSLTLPISPGNKRKFLMYFIS
ncbi:DNase I-like protein [Crassisporium funariophilum]|nr:DNase I-like protein [Crassisporium funariophilum]